MLCEQVREFVAWPRKCHKKLQNSKFIGRAQSTNVYHPVGYLTRAEARGMAELFLFLLAGLWVIGMSVDPRFQVVSSGSLPRLRCGRSTRVEDGMADGGQREGGEATWISSLGRENTGSWQEKEQSPLVDTLGRPESLSFEEAEL